MTCSVPLLLKCPCCGSDHVRVFYEAPSVPVNSVLLVSSREEALRFPTGDISLGFCNACGFIYNTSFDRRLVEYSSRCEETQGFSAYFREWHENLARRLIHRYGLRAKKIVEIGCGKGEFLTLLCDLGHNRGIGFDPAYIPERVSSESASHVEFIADLYNEDHTGIRADFLCCKMTLEHINNTGEFVRMVRRSLKDSSDTCVFFQVPDVLRVLEEEAFWDVYYEHCSYFSIGSLARLFRRCGFNVLNVGREYGDQYVTVEARSSNGAVSVLPAEDDLDQLRSLVQRFTPQVSRRIEQWRERLEDFRNKGLKTVLWGAGSKGVAFLATLRVQDAVQYVVDINPYMTGHYMAKTGAKIIAPTDLREYRPDVVIIMNRIYRREIVGELSNLGLRPEVTSI